MLEIIAAAVATLVMPFAGSREAQFIQTQLSLDAEFRDKAAAVTSELWIGPDGRVLNCTVVRFTGDKAVADRVCELMKQRRLRAPKGPSGVPSYAISEMTTGWGSSAVSSRLAQELVSLGKPDRIIPAVEGASGDEKVVLLVAIDAQGRASACQSLKRDRSGRLAEYCNYVAEEHFAAMRDEQGQRVNYLRTYDVQLAVNP